MSSTKIPSFCIVGQANQGKTTLLATLTENDRLQISNMPGTTTVATEYPVMVDDEKIMSFWDTPGFENSPEVDDWFKKHADTSENPAKDFIVKFQNDAGFRAECEIFRPVAEGAVVIFIVDSSQRVRDTDRQQVAILRQCGNHRLAVIYSKDGKARHQDEWVRLLARDFNLRVEFNAHKAGIGERFRLLDKIKTMFPDREKEMNDAIKVLKEDHERKRSESIGHLITMLRNVLKRRESMALDEKKEHKKIRKDLDAAIRKAVREEEKQYRKNARKSFGHSEEHWKMEDVLTEEVFAEDVWKVLGLTKTQLGTVGATLGASIGAIIDAHFAFATFGAFTVLGGIAGGASAYMSAERVAMVAIPKIGFLRRWFGGKKLGGAYAIAFVDPRSKLLGILIDRGMLYLEQVINRPHGLDDATPKFIPTYHSNDSVVGDEAHSKASNHPKTKEGDTPPSLKRNGLTNTWSQDEHKSLGTFLGEAAKDAPDAIKLDAAKANLKRILIKQFQILNKSSNLPPGQSNDTE